MTPIAIFALCSLCDGHGWIPSFPLGPRTELCPDCFGKGCRLSKDGQSILSLLNVAGLTDLMPES